MSTTRAIASILTAIVLLLSLTIRADTVPTPWQAMPSSLSGSKEVGTYLKLEWSYTKGVSGGIAMRAWIADGTIKGSVTDIANGNTEDVGAPTAPRHWNAIHAESIDGSPSRCIFNGGVDDGLGCYIRTFSTYHTRPCEGCGGEFYMLAFMSHYYGEPTRPGLFKCSAPPDTPIYIDPETSRTVGPCQYHGRLTIDGVYNPYVYSSSMSFWVNESVAEDATRDDADPNDNRFHGISDGYCFVDAVGSYCPKLVHFFGNRLDGTDFQWQRVTTNDNFSRVEDIYPSSLPTSDGAQWPSLIKAASGFHMFVQDGYTGTTNQFRHLFSCNTNGVSGPWRVVSTDLPVFHSDLGSHGVVPYYDEGTQRVIVWAESYRWGNTPTDHTGIYIYDGDVTAC